MEELDFTFAYKLSIKTFAIYNTDFTLAYELSIKMFIC